MSNQTAFERATKGILDGIGEEVAYAIDDIRHQFEIAAYGREVTPDTAEFYRWLNPDQPDGREAGGKGDPMGRTIEAEVEPPEGRPSTHDEREATAEAYAFHCEAGVHTLEIDDAHSQEWNEFEAWLDGKGGGQEIEQAGEREGPEIGS